LASSPVVVVNLGIDFLISGNEEEKVVSSIRLRNFRSSQFIC